MKTKIEWTEYTWNPIRGCSKVSEGCRLCYAAGTGARFSKKEESSFFGYAIMTTTGPQWTGKVDLMEHKLDEPLHWRKPRRIFVNSMSDLFHEELSDADIRRVFDVMNAAPQHTYQILTKRAERLAELGPRLPWHKNIWMGVSVENSDVLWRIDYLRRCGSPNLFLSLEPLIGPLDELDLTGMHWVIAGGESGPEARPMKREWVIPILEDCKRLKIPFFFKQWGKMEFNPDPIDVTASDYTKGGAKGGCQLDGKIYHEMPGGDQPVSKSMLKEAVCPERRGIPVILRDMKKLVEELDRVAG